MSAAKAASAPLPTKQASRAVRNRVPVDADSLASDLDRVLRVSQPKAPTKHPRRTVSASSSKAKPVKEEPKSTSSRARNPATRPPHKATRAGEKPRAKGKAPPSDDWPWMKAGAMSSRERAQEAQDASNAALRLLSEAAQAGFKYPSNSKGEWTRARADQVFRSASTGLGVLRDLYGGSDSTPARRALVERGAITLVTLCIGLEMYAPALETLVATRPHVLKLYGHDGETLHLPALPPLTAEWTALLDLPPAATDIDEGIRSILCSFIMSAWCCVLSLGLQPDYLVTCFPQPPSGPTSAHPFTLAPILPLSAVGQLAVYLYRLARDDRYEQGTPAWLQIRLFSAFASAVSASGSGDAKNSPERVWSSVRRTVAIHMENGGEDARREAADHIGRVVDVVDKLWVARQEPREAWFCGHWSAVLDVWTDIGRLLGDSSIIDRILSAATAGATIASASDFKSTSPVASGSLTPSSSKREVRRPAATAANAAAEVTKACAHLAKILIEVTTPGVSAEAYQRSLADVNFEAIATALCSLKPTTSHDALPSLLRSIERLRRTVVKSLDTPTLEGTSMIWLHDCLEFVGRLLPGLEANEDAVRECMPGVIDSTLALMKRNNTPECTALSLNQLDAVFATFDQHSSTIGMASQAHYANCLIQCAYSLALRFSNSDGLPMAIALCRRSCEWSQAFLSRHGDVDEAVRKSIFAPLCKRFELLGFCLQKGADKTEALQAYIQSSLCLDSSAIKQISAESTTKPLRLVFQPFTEFAASLKRPASLLNHDPSLAAEFAALLANELNGKQWSPSVTGPLVEQVIDAIEPSQYLEHVQTVLVALHHMTLDLYDAESYPVRRLRAILRFVSVITSTGAAADMFDALKAEADALYAVKELAKDVGLAKYRQEYYGSILILSSLQTYHQTESSDTVYESGRAALDASRSFILPPPPCALTSKRTATARSKAPAAARVAKAPARTTARKVTPTAAKGKATTSATKAEPPSVAVEMDNAERFSGLLNALASLLGLLGYIVPKIEALNLLRALQRNSPDMIDAFIQTSSQVATEYGRLGKYSRAAQVFAKAIKQANDANSDVSPAARTELHLRHSRFLALAGQTNQARQDFMTAKELSSDIPAPGATGTVASRWIQICALSERTALAHAAVAAIKMAEADVTVAVANLVIAYRLWSRAASGIAHIAAAAPVDESAEPTKEATAATAKDKKKPFFFDGKRLGGLQWYFAEALFEATFDVSLALARQGSVKECEYYLLQARNMVASVRSSTLDARTASRTAEFETRRLRFDKTVEQIDHASSVLTVDGPDVVDIQRIKGELYLRQQEAPAADEQFANAVERLVGLDKVFMSAESRMPSARKDSLAPALAGSREPLMPLSLGHLLRKRAWLMCEGGLIDEYEEILEQLDLVPRSSGDKPEQLLLEARVAMHDAFRHFKTDLFMSSLTESTIALTMGSPGKRVKERHSSRHEAVLQLERASSAFRTTLASIAQTGRVEDVRQTCVSLALLGAFQTSLGHGSPATTASAACTLASVSTITLHRELLSAIDSKYADPEADDMDWPTLDAPAYEAGDAIHAYWEDVRAKHADLDLIRSDYDLSSLPANWAVVSITVTDDRNTMLVTRHQNGHEPIVFCIPLDRQGRREGEDESELFSFDAGVAEMRAIISGNDASIKSIKDRVSMDDRKAWWKERHDLDTRLSELLATIEFCWLGAFKTVLNPRLEFDPDALAAFRARLDRIFQAALTAGGSDARRASRVRLNDTLLACFATLSSKSKDEEVEDLVYFVLDLYQFHGIAVALAELDFDQIGVDVKSALSDLELATGHCSRDETDEHLLLALDKNVQCFPWESIPILRGRAVSRITSLPLLLDQVELGSLLGADAAHRTVDARRTRYFLNPGGDLVNTQKRFEDRLTGLQSEGWQGVTARRPSESEMANALSESELVMYFGHGGGEEFIRGHKVRSLRQCAVTMLWGCSSGLLRDQGDLDCTGTPYDYALAGAPCLVANLWDVTDKDIDRITASVMDQLALESGRLGHESVKGTSVVQAVSKGRTAARLQYLTGAALVVYGVPVYMA